MQRKAKLLSLFLGLAIGVSLVILVVHFQNTKTPTEKPPTKSPDVQLQTGQTTTQPTEPEFTTFNPEIPINEYWDWGNINDLSLYINNTDKSIIYALDETGKVVWTIRGKEYGIDGFEIRKMGNKLVIKDTETDALNTYWGKLWIFDGDGKLRWKHAVKGYLDFPQLRLTEDNYLILENRSDNLCNAGCGTICREKLKGQCFENHLWAFDMDTGSIMWRNNTPNYYGHYFESSDIGKLKSRSGGIGWGRLIHEYIIDSKTGVIESQIVSIDDGEYNTDKNTRLTLNVNNEEIYLHTKWKEDRMWTLDNDSVLYKWIFEHLHGTYKTIILEDIIFSFGTNDDGKILVRSFDKADGTLLWEKNMDTGDFAISPLQLGNEDGVIILNLAYLSTCTSVCMECAEGSIVCIGKERTKECKECRAGDKTRPGYSENDVWGVDDKTGSVIWKKTNVWFSGVENGKAILQKPDYEKMAIDPRKGVEVPMKDVK